MWLPRGWTAAPISPSQLSQWWRRWQQLQSSSIRSVTFCYSLLGWTEDWNHKCQSAIQQRPEMKEVQVDNCLNSGYRTNRSCKTKLNHLYTDEQIDILYVVRLLKTVPVQAAGYKRLLPWWILVHLLFLWNPPFNILFKRIASSLQAMESVLGDSSRFGDFAVSLSICSFVLYRILGEILTKDGTCHYGGWASAWTYWLEFLGPVALFPTLACR